MKFSTKATYGLRAMIRLAKSGDKESVSLSSIAKAENISQKYLERLFSDLKKANLVKAEKGVAGGYRLLKDPSEINILDVINALEGRISPFHCYNKDKDEKMYCNVGCNCGVTFVLSKIQQSVAMTLKDIKLNQL